MVVNAAVAAGLLCGGGLCVCWRWQWTLGGRCRANKHRRSCVPSYLLYSPPLDMSENLNASSSPLGPFLSDSMSSALPHWAWLPKSSLYVSYHLWEDGTRRRTAGKRDKKARNNKVGNVLVVKVTSWRGRERGVKGACAYY